MAKGQIVWWGAVAGLLGIAAAIVDVSFVLLSFAAIAVGVALHALWSVRTTLLVAVFVGFSVGFVYVPVHGKIVHGDNMFPQDGETFKAVVASAPKSTDHGAWAYANLVAPHSGRVALWWPSEYSFVFGEHISAVGEIDRSGMSREPFLFVKDMHFTTPPEPSIRGALFSAKEKFLEPFYDISGDAGALGAGITFGKREFSSNFEEAMRQSGTTHLVALSGYNIAILVSAIFFLVLGWVPRRVTFIVTASVVLFFVLMVGGEASIVRAALMGLLALFAQEMGRVYSFSRGVVYAALAMAVWDPYVFLDIGFQLSFASLLGIGYLLPRLQKWWNNISEKGWLGIREHFLTTASAQLAVMPLLFWHFGSVSPTSLIANTLILPVMPLTMALSFLYTGLANVWWPLAFAVGKAAELLLSYEVGIIYLFG